MLDFRCKNAQCQGVSHSHMTHIPIEILSNIFYFHLQISGSSTNAQRRSCLAQVCRLWRAIVESNPALWTFIHLRFYKKNTDDAQRMQAILDLHFKHSGAMPLSLAFTDCRRIIDKNTELIPLLADQIRRHSRRWKHISLDLTYDDVPHLFTQFTPCDLSSLEHLQIHGDGYPTHSPPLCLDSATNIKSFTSCGSASPWINAIEIHWGRLEVVSFDFEPSNRLLLNQNLTHLGDCQNLITCSLGIGRTRRLPSWQTMTFPRLQTLRIRRLSTEVDTNFFHFLVLPQLETFEIDSRFLVGSYIPHTPWQDRMFSNLLARSGCTVRHLSVQDVDFPSEELVRCLKLSPTLTSLCFVPYPRSQDIGDVVRELVASPTTHTLRSQTKSRDGMSLLFPELRKITLGISRERCLNPIMTMLLSRGKARTRAAGVVALRHIEVIFYRKGPSNPTCLCQPHESRAKLQKIENFKRKVARWASEVEIENAGDKMGVVASVEIQITDRGL